MKKSPAYDKNVYSVQEKSNTSRPDKIRISQININIDSSSENYAVKTSSQISKFSINWHCG